MSDSVFLTDGNGTITGLVAGTSYSGDLVIPEYVDGERITAIGVEAFHKCSNLTRVSSSAVTSIGHGALLGCAGLTGVDFPVATIIGIAAFKDCDRLTSVSFPAVTNIGNYAFDDSINLTSVDFPVATIIGEGAFYYCDSLTSCSFPAVTNIGYEAFWGCHNLTTVYVDDPDNLSEAFSSYNWSNTGSSGVVFAKYVDRNLDYLIKAGTLMDIAGAIREKTGGTEPIKVSDLAAAIWAIPT